MSFNFSRPYGRRMAAICLLLMLAQASAAYSVLTHEEVIDLLWLDKLQPLLKKRFPDASPAQLKAAHAYAYGGSLIQDMGYYPFGNKYFSDLTHYVRAGDFVTCLIDESSDLNEYAFALGALAHYAADNSGHPTINRAVASEFPALRRKYGDEVTYADNPNAHIRVEFGFDMTQVAKNRYTSDVYHDFIGFEISQALLDRAFHKTYGIKFSSVIADQDLAIGTFRHAVSKVIPQMTRVALLARKDEIVKDTPNANERTFRYYLSRRQYEKNWGTHYQRPGFGARLLAILLKLFPKRGPFSGLAFKIPTTATEDLYIRSVNLTIEDYTRLLNDLDAKSLSLANKDFDTGREAKVGEYVLADKTYAKLLEQLAKDNFAEAPPELRSNIILFYGDSHGQVDAQIKPSQWKKTQEELQQLKSSQSEAGTQN
jgi:Zinc dependent phospholipase C